MDASYLSEMETPPPRPIGTKIRLKYYLNYMSIIGIFMVIGALVVLSDIDNLMSPESIARAKENDSTAMETKIQMYATVALFFLGGVASFIFGVRTGHYTVKLLTDGTLGYARITETVQTGTFKGIPLYTISFIYLDTLGVEHSGSTQQAGLEEIKNLEVGMDVPMLFNTNDPDTHRLFIEI